MNRNENRKRQADILVSMISFITIILLVNLIGDLGILYFAIATECYLVLHVLLSDCIPDQMARMMRSRMGKGQYKNAVKVVKTASVYGIVTGICGTCILFILSNLIAQKLFHMPEISIALRIMSPALFLQAICCVLKGIFKGIGTNIPAVISSLLSELFGLFFVIMFGGMLYTYGQKASALLQNQKFASMYGAAGATIGIPLSFIFAIAFLLLMYFAAGRRILKKKREGMRLTEDGIDVLRMFLSFMLPVVAVRTLLRLPVISGFAIFAGTNSGNIDALTSCGTLYGTAFVIIGIGISLALILCTSVENAVVSSVKHEEYKIARSYLAGGVQGIFMFGSFLTVMCLIFAPDIIRLIFKNTNFEIAFVALQIVSPMILFLPLGIYLSRILMGIGRRLTVIAGACVSYLTYILVVIIGGKNTNDIKILLYALWIYAIVFCLWNSIFLLWLLRVSLPWLTAVGLPVLCAGITGLLLYMYHKTLANIFSPIVLLVIGLFIGGIVYMFLLYILRCIRPKELYALPGGRFLGKLGKFLHLF